MPTPVPRWVADAVKRHITPYRTSRLQNFVAEVGAPLAIKYVESRRVREYPSPGETGRLGGRLKISTSLSYTWGTATYVTPLAFPLSSAIYGRAGIVARFDPLKPAEWRIYDATDLDAQSAYIQWLERQALFPLLALTVHSRLMNQLMRDAFRTAFKIDCVLFAPDQVDVLPVAGYQRYTHPNDTWMAVSDWHPGGGLRGDFSERLQNGRFTVLVAEEFEPVAHDLVYTPLIGTPVPSSNGLASTIRSAYENRATSPVFI